MISVGSRTITPSAPRHCPSARQMVRPSGKRGVTSSAMNARHSASLTSPPPGIDRPQNRRSASTAWETVGCTVAHAVVRTRARTIEARRIGTSSIIGPVSYSIKPRFRIVDGEGTIVMGPGKADLLDAVARSGSIRAAAEELGMSYMRAWTLIRTMNAAFRSPLVEKERGGSAQGGAQLTPRGRKVLEL